MVYGLHLHDTLAQTLLNPRTVHDSLVVRAHPHQELSTDTVFLSQLQHHLLYSSWQEHDGLRSAGCCLFSWKSKRCLLLMHLGE